MRATKALLLALVTCLLMLCVPHTSAAMMDMPDDPVSGEMVMSAEYNFELKYGQRLRFANAKTLRQFEKDPSTGLGEVRMVDKPDAAYSTATNAVALCPVCGMETSATGGGPQVLVKHGDQSIHTCNVFHAHQVHDEILSFSAASEELNDQGLFCTGPGTAMLNGFAIFQGARVSSACVLLWFPGWVLNTPWRYLLGCFTIIGCAMFNEYLLQLRRRLRKESNVKRLLSEKNTGTSEASKLLRPRTYSASSYILTSSASPSGMTTWFRTLSGDAQHMVHCVLHGATIFLAYMLMLVSMTYDGVLFLCCIVGYILGHFVFGERREAVPEADADALSFVTA